jgi:RNA polymerase sigma factor (sigma-70 family)
MEDRRTDSELLESIRSGDDHAFATLYERHAKASIQYAHASAGADAEDVVSEVWMRVWMNPPKHGESFQNWLRIVVRRSAYRFGRRRTLVGTLKPGPSSGTSPTRGLARREAVSLLHQARASGDLTTREFSAIVHDLDESRSQTELASESGLSRTAWADRVRRARKKLRIIALGEAAAGRPRR